MSKSFKKREMKKAQSLVLEDMLLSGRGKGGNTFLRDRRERRPKDSKNHWTREWETE